MRVIRVRRALSAFRAVPAQGWSCVERVVFSSTTRRPSERRPSRTRIASGCSSAISDPRRVSVTWSQNGVVINGNTVGPTMSLEELERWLGKPDRVSSGVNRIHTYDKLGIHVYEPYDGMVHTLSIDLHTERNDFT